MDASDAKRRAKDPETGESVVVENMTYEEWEKGKKKENETAWEAYTRKGKNASSDQKQFADYQAVLGKNAPKTFADFQNLKYNDAEAWEQLKTEKRQTVFVKDAPCVTTPKKYTGYFLKPGAKHADQFFDVGYTQDNPLQLRYDMARQFDTEKSVDMKELGGGARKFNIYMELGVTKKRTFFTGWIQDTPDSPPRVVTGFRKNKEKKHDT